ncbi:Uncharacterised protein [Kingella kingae]|uniref:hypothetical protein n=1 Tax=Kingella kingae TaxID=504 RepID=UPI000E0452F0|nr:hypothetical protein [Kingella kingae]STR01427.1 Uncharacterised protein [Kingella kingae]
MICEAPQKSPAEQEIDDLLDLLKDEDYSRAIGSVNTAYEEFRKGLDQINQNKQAGFISEAEAAKQEVKLYERLSSKAQKAYQNVLDDMPRRYKKTIKKLLEKERYYKNNRVICKKLLMHTKSMVGHLPRRQLKQPKMPKFLVVKSLVMVQ